jgi:hypothetical protein
MKAIHAVRGVLAALCTALGGLTIVAAGASAAGTGVTAASHFGRRPNPGLSN